MFISRDPIGLLGGDNVFKYEPNPVQWIDSLGLYANATYQLEENKIDINIPILFSGEAFSHERVQEWKKAIENAYTGQFNGFNVCTTVTLLEKPIEGNFNSIKIKYDMSCDSSIESCFNHINSSNLMNTGTFFSSASNGTIVHEVGHMLGIGFDPYLTKPFKRSFARWTNVMGNSLHYPDKVDDLMFSAILDSDSNAINWKNNQRPEHYKHYDDKLDAEDLKNKYAEQGIEFNIDIFSK